MQPLPTEPATIKETEMLSPSTLVVVGVRNMYDWALAMHRWCYCCVARTVRHANDTAAFISLPYTTTELTKDCNIVDIDARVANEAPKPWDNLIAMRQAKLENLLELRRWVAGVEIVQLEQVWAAHPRVFEMLKTRLAKWDLPWNASVDAVGARDSRPWVATPFEPLARVQRRFVRRESFPLSMTTERGRRRWPARQKRRPAASLP